MKTEPRFDCPPPRVELLPDGRNVRVVDYEIRFFDSKEIEWVAPVGFETDGASIPSVLWKWIGGPFEGLHRDGAILHDQAYSIAPPWESGFIAADRSPFRAAADRMLYEASIARGTSRWKAWTIYRGVRLGGGFAWRGHAQQNAKERTGA